jgi:lipoprotein signal peptidase
VAAGGVLGNGISWIVYVARVPDPLFAAVGDGVAFNLADVFVLAGLMGQAAALARHGARRRGSSGAVT